MHRKSGSGRRVAKGCAVKKNSWIRYCSGRSSWLPLCEIWMRTLTEAAMRVVIISSVFICSTIASLSSVSAQVPPPDPRPPADTTHARVFSTQRALGGAGSPTTNVRGALGQGSVLSGPQHPGTQMLVAPGITTNSQ
jgi:hypothetical protein